MERIGAYSGRTEFLYDPSGTDMGNFNGANGAWYEQYVPFEGRVLWYYTPSGNRSRYFHVNSLGSLGLATDQTGAPVEEILYYPFGGVWENNGTAWDEKFARLQTHDQDIATDMTNNRLYKSLLGRWLTPDPTGGHVTNPQSLNRYAYVTNNPTTLNDPSGLDPWGDPGDRCSDPTYAEGHAQCQGLCDPAYSSYYTDALCGGFGGGYYDGGGDYYGGGGGGTEGVIGGGGGVSGGTSVGGPPMGGGAGAMGISPYPPTGNLNWPWIIRIDAWGMPYLENVLLASLPLEHLQFMHPGINKPTASKGASGPVPAKRLQFPPSPAIKFLGCTALSTAVAQSCLVNTCLPMSEQPELAVPCGIGCGLLYLNREKNYCKKNSGIH